MVLMETCCLLQTTAQTLQLHQFVNTCMPFGSVTCSNPFLMSQLINPSGKGKAKVCPASYSPYDPPQYEGQFFCYKYTVFILLFHVAQQVYHIESLHHAGCPMTAAVLRAMIKETHCLKRRNIAISFRWVSSLLLLMFYILWVPIRSNYFSVFFAILSVMSCSVC